MASFLHISGPKMKQRKLRSSTVAHLRTTRKQTELGEKGQATSVTFKGLSSGLLSSEPSKIVSLLGTKLLLVYEPNIWAEDREDKLGK